MFRTFLALAASLVMATVVTLALAAQPQTQAANDAVDYIKTLQNADGGFPAFGSGSSPGSTLDAVFAIEATGQDSTAVITGGNSPDDYLGTQAVSYSADAGGAAKLALGVSTMGLDPTVFGGVNLIATMDGNYNGVTGSYGSDLFDQAFFMLARTAAGETVPGAAVLYLINQQEVDGGWEFAAGFGSDTNTTALAIQALRGAGITPNSPPMLDGLAYLDGAQNADGGFGFVGGSESDPNSTAFVIQALVAAGQNIDEGGPFAPNGNTPLEALLSFRNATTGAFQYAGEDSPFATYQAVPALMLAPFPGLQTVAPVGGMAGVPDIDGEALRLPAEASGDRGTLVPLAAGATGLAALGLAFAGWREMRRRSGGDGR
jgi:hypothetical protein